MKKYNHLSREQRYTIDRLLKSKVSPILSLQNPLEWPLVLSLERSVGIKPLGKIFLSAGGDICLGTQGMALLSAQIHLEDATRCRTNYPAATMVARANRLEGIPIVGKTSLYTFLHKDKNGSYHRGSATRSHPYSDREKDGVCHH